MDTRQVSEVSLWRGPHRHKLTAVCKRECMHTARARVHTHEYRCALHTRALECVHMPTHMHKYACVYR